MSTCPNVNTAEWKALVEGVTEFEAYRDYMETGGKIRTVAEVQAKLSQRTDSTASNFEKNIISQDDKSYYRGQIEKPTIDEDGNLILYAREDELYKRAGLKSKGVSMTDDLQSAIEYGNGQLEVAQNLASESYDANTELERLSENGYYLIQIPKHISNEIVKEAGEVKIIGDKIIISKGQYKIEQVVDGEESKSTLESQLELEFGDVQGSLLAQAAILNAEQNPEDSLFDDQAIAVGLATSMSAMLNVDYQVTTAAEALILDPNWSGQKGFFVGGRVYFVGDHLNLSTVFHEFSHPFVRHIAKTNPKLFNALYNQVKGTEEGTEIIDTVKESHGLDFESDYFKEEVLVKSLTASGVAKLAQLKEQSPFAKVINNILYAIKQAIRQIFGSKSNVSGLNVNTTMSDLTEMLVKGEKITIDKDLVSQADFVAYEKDRKEFAKEFVNAGSGFVQKTIDDFVGATTTHLKVLKDNQNYAELNEILKDAEKASDIEQMKSTLHGFQSQVMKKTTDLSDDIEYVGKQATALTNSMFRLGVVIEKIKLHIADLQKSGTSKENMQHAYHYNNLIEHWQKFVTEAQEGMRTYNVPSNEIHDLLARMNTDLSIIRDGIKKMNAVGAKDALYEHLSPAYSNIKDTYDTMIANLRKKPQSTFRDEKIDKLYKQYHGVTQAEHARLRELETSAAKGHLPKAEANELESLKQNALQGIAITPEKIELILTSGTGIGDAHFYNSYLEGYLYNNDPVIGGLASYVKNNLNTVMATAQSKYNKFAKDTFGLIEDAGYNPLIIGDFGNRISFRDKVGKMENGVLVEQEVITFLSPFKNYRLAYDKHSFAVREATEEFARTGSNEAKIEMNRIKTLQDIFLREEFNQEFTPEFYEKDKLFQKDIIGQAALQMRRDWNIEYKSLVDPTIGSPQQQLDITDEVDLMWRKWRQMSSLTDLDGNIKTGMYKVIVDGVETMVAEIDIANRIKEYTTASYKFYHSVEKPGIFQNSLEAYLQQLVDNNVAEIGDATYISMKQNWLNKNTKKVPTQAWYDRRSELYVEQSAIYAKLDPKLARALDESVIMNEIFDLTGGFKDDYAQTIAPEMSEGSRLRVVELEKELAVLRKNGVKLNGLTAVQNARFNELNRLRSTEQWTAELNKEASDLFILMNDLGLSKYDKQRLNDIKAELSGLSENVPTDYYIDIMNNWLGQLTVKNKIFKSVDTNNIDLLLLPENINRLLGQNADFDSWFQANHLITEFWNKDTDGGAQLEERWTRSRLWSSTIPMDKEHFETYNLVDAVGNVVETIEGKPINKYYNREVKPEYRTEKIVGVTIDNQGHWLPKTVAQGGNKDFENERYFELKNADPNSKDGKLFKAMEKMKEHHLMNQEGVQFNGRLYLDFPRTRKSNLELIQSDHFLTNIVQRMKDFFHRAKDDADDGFNFNKQELLVRLDMFDNEASRVPISGVYDIPVDDVSTDITTTMMRYMLSAERQKQLVELLPMARAIQKVVNDSDNSDVDEMYSTSFMMNTLNPFGKQNGSRVRKKAINSFIQREFFGQEKTGAGAESAWLNNTATLLFKRASQTFFAFNIASALKNSYGAKFQAMIEASAGNNLTHTTLQQGNIWAYGLMGELSFGGQLYQKGARSLKQQITQIFDPSQGREADTFGEGMSRTIAKDAASFSWTTNFRKWVELQATFQIFGGMMYHKQIEQIQADGSIKMIPYIEAWELKDELIQLREGIDPKWGITYNEKGEIQVGDEFNRFKTKIHIVMNNLQGAYAKFDQPEAQRYIAFRFLSYLRRYFTTMVMNRFGHTGRFFDPQPRVNPGLGDIHTGYYITFMNTLKDVVTSYGENLMYMTDEEKRAGLKFMTEIAMLFATTFAMSLLFGWDPDDEDKYKKLRERSGALPFPFVPDDPKRPFNGWGWTENHMLYLLMNIRAENEQFLPLPNIGLDDYTALLDLKSIAFGPTVKSYQQLITDGLDIMHGKESANYSRDIGPYEWQEKGSPKIYAHFAAMFTMKGSNIDPAVGIKNFQSVQAMAKR